MSAERVIWKYDLPTVGAAFWLEMPADAQILTAQLQGLQTVLWALVDPTAAAEQRQFILLGTGWQLAAQPRQYISTLQDHLGLVWHVFELPVEETS